MTIKIVRVLGVVVTALDTPVNTNFLLLFWLVVRQFVPRKVTGFECFVIALVTSMNRFTFLHTFCLLKKA